MTLCASTAGGTGLIPGQGTKIPHAGQKKKKIIYIYIYIHIYIARPDDPFVQPPLSSLH